MKPINIEPHRWEYFWTQAGWDLHITPPDALGDAVIRLKCSEPRIRVVSRAVEISNALRTMRVVYGSKREDTEVAPFMETVEGLPNALELKDEPNWGLERYPWGAPRFIYEVQQRSSDTGIEPVPPEDSQRVMTDPHEFRRVGEDVAGDIVHSLDLYRRLASYLELLGVRL